MQENKTKDAHTGHHGKAANVVGIGASDESFVLGMLQWTYRGLKRRVEIGVANAFIVDYKLVDSIDIWQLQDGLVDFACEWNQI